MSFKNNTAQQISLHDITNNLTARERKMLEKSWAKDFAERIFPIINENRYSVLYSDKASRPNTPVNIIIGALILKEIFNLTDDELIETLMFDIRYRYALHTTSYTEQPLSDKTLSRFRMRCYTHETDTGIDLIRDTITELSGEMAAIMKINRQLKRMDSFMVASNIRKLSRLELLYTCVSNIVTRLHKQHHGDLLAGLEHYYDPDDYNRVIYHNRSTETDTRIGQVIMDAERLITDCTGSYDDSNEFRLLLRAMNEQTIHDGNSNTRLRTKDDGGMDSHILQNPSDPDATFREKSGKQHIGYVANVTESSGENGSVITNYRFEQNTHSDSRFLNETIDAMGFQPERTTIVTDGSYGGTNNIARAAEHNIELAATDMAGRKANDAHADFTFSDDGRRLLTCAAGKAPKSCSYATTTGQCRVSYHRDDCVNCANKDRCRPKIYKRTAVLVISKKSSERALLQRKLQTDDYRRLSRFRNGIESIPSTLRRRYGIDTMPVRGKVRVKFFFGFKIAAMNFRKLVKYLGAPGIGMSVGAVV